MNDKDLEQKVISLFCKEKHSLYKIQKELKIDYHKVRRFLSQNNISFPQQKVKKVNESEVVRLYSQEKMTLRMVGEKLDIDHHRVARILEKNRINVTTVGRKRKPFSDEHKRKISETSKGRPSHWKGKKMPTESLYKNMKAHLHWDVDLKFLQQFEDVERLKVVNSLLGRERVAKHFSKEKYKTFITKFYNDSQFIKVYKDYIVEKKSYAYPSLDHIVPLSKGGGWDIDNLQILSWVENRAKYNFLPDEWEYIKKKYFGK